MGELRLLGEPPASDDHAALANLAFPQAGHTGFVAAAGLAGGQTIIGGVAAGENLSLQSTAHAARGYVRAQDDLQLLSNVIRDSAANQRIALASASPHLTLTGDVLIAAGAGQSFGRLAVAPATFDITKQVALGGAFGNQAGTLKILDITPAAGVASPNLLTLVGVSGLANLGPASGATAYLYGLQFLANAYGQGAVPEMYALWCRLGSSLASTPTITKAATLYARSPLFSGAKPQDCFGLYVEPHGAAGITNAVGAFIDAPALGANNYTIWAGAPLTGTPRLRLDAGTPGANQTMLYLAEGVSPTVRRVQWKLYTNLVATDRVMVLV